MNRFLAPDKSLGENLYPGAPVDPVFPSVPVQFNGVDPIIEPGGA